jgi:hypothetical protein
MTAEAAMLMADMNYKVHLLPLCGQFVTKVGDQELTSLVTVTGKSMIAREPVPDDDTWKYFGIASDKYGIVQNLELAQMVDRLTGDWPVETVGALDGGKTIFLTLDAGTHKVGGFKTEEIKKYFLVTDTKDGGTSLRIAFTPVRVVCQNTLVSGLKAATIQGALQHNSKVGGNLDFRIDLMGRLMKAEKTVTEQFDRMAKFIITEDEWDKVIELAYPYYPKPKKAAMLDEFSVDEKDLLLGMYAEAQKAQETWEYYNERVDAFRAGARELFGKFNDEFPKVAKTAWGIYNAIVETEDFREGADSVPESALFGARSQTKKRAFDAAYSLVR